MSIIQDRDVADSRQVIAPRRRGERPYGVVRTMDPLKGVVNYQATCSRHRGFGCVCWITPPHGVDCTHALEEVCLWLGKAELSAPEHKKLATELMAKYNTRPA